MRQAASAAANGPTPTRTARMGMCTALLSAGRPRQHPSAAGRAQQKAYVGWTSQGIRTGITRVNKFVSVLYSFLRWIPRNNEIPCTTG